MIDNEYEKKITTIGVIVAPILSLYTTKLLAFTFLMFF